jgi:hypothetical protein
MNLCKQIANGSLVLDKFEEFAIIQPNLNKQDNKTPHDKWKENFRVLMKSTDLFNDQLIDKRFQQFQYYLRLSNLNEIVRVLTQVKSLNRLTARFDFLEDLENSVSGILIPMTMNVVTKCTNDYNYKKGWSRHIPRETGERNRRKVDENDQNAGRF